MKAEHSSSPVAAAPGSKEQAACAGCEDGAVAAAPACGDPPQRHGHLFFGEHDRWGSGCSCFVF